VQLDILLQPPAMPRERISLARSPYKPIRVLTTEQLGSMEVTLVWKQPHKTFHSKTQEQAPKVSYEHLAIQSSFIEATLCSIRFNHHYRPALFSFACIYCYRVSTMADNKPDPPVDSQQEEEERQRRARSVPYDFSALQQQVIDDLNRRQLEENIALAQRLSRQLEEQERRERRARGLSPAPAPMSSDEMLAQKNHIEQKRRALSEGTNSKPASSFILTDEAFARQLQIELNDEFMGKCRGRSSRPYSLSTKEPTVERRKRTAPPHPRSCQKPSSDQLQWRARREGTWAQKKNSGSVNLDGVYSRTRPNQYAGTANLLWQYPLSSRALRLMSIC
jgi:hypothetical protein